MTHRAAPELFTTCSVVGLRKTPSVQSLTGTDSQNQHFTVFFPPTCAISRTRKVFLTLFFSYFLWLQNYTSCRCILGSYARPAPCPNRCPHFLLPVILIIALASLVACLTHNPMYMMVLRYGIKTVYWFIFYLMCSKSVQTLMSWFVWPLQKQLTVFLFIHP